MDRDSLNLLGTVVLVVLLATVALQARIHLGANTDTLAHLELGHLVPDMSDLADDLVARHDPVFRQRSPAASDGVDIRALSVSPAPALEANDSHRHRSTRCRG